MGGWEVDGRVGARRSCGRHADKVVVTGDRKQDTRRGVPRSETYVQTFGV